MAGRLPEISFNFGADATAEMIPGRLESLASAGAKRVMLDSVQLTRLERQLGKESEDIAERIRIGWDDDRVIFQEDQLGIMLPYVITGHFHDNNGKNDGHKMPGQGIIGLIHSDEVS